MESAEDYYGNDYPEDEVASDDEFDAGAYNYRHNASDGEEYDLDQAAFSDEDEADPANQFRLKHILRNPPALYDQDE